ncbi:MAG TPA: phosphoglucomutase (alpha-D-glucose-1,6-bisphosphate-dependent) [Candidatus Binatia bacterium]|nr:phosphoglucomutase (alpha-D-glucose-1,6-bisphosphate-dependent) [Candidatus Binatia bacterium]
MSTHPLAGKAAPPELLIDVSQLERDYYQRQPDPADPHQLVSFGTSGHRGSPFDATFTQVHILAITQAICDYRRRAQITGPLFLGRDTHAASTPAQGTALEVLAGNGVETCLQHDQGVTPTPVISWAILVHNRGRVTGLADGIIITPSHNPPSDGGLKYNSPNGGPADTEATGWIEDRANALIRAGNREVKRTPLSAALRAATIHQRDFLSEYVADLGAVVDLESVRSAGLKIGVDPLGGASLQYWEPIQRRFGINLTVVNPRLDPTFGFMMVDHDGKIRMDCSSPFAMAGLVNLKHRFDIAFGNDPDADRHGIVAPSVGLMNPNHYLAVAIDYLLAHRPQWAATSAVGKTVVSSSLIDRVVQDHRRRLLEVPVGFKWFTPVLFDGSCCFAGEESAGASFLRRDGTVWCTDKDGLILGLLAAEIVARTAKDPGEHYQQLTAKFGAPCYTRLDAPATPEQKSALKKLSPEAVTAKELAGEPILAKLTRAPGNDAPIGGLKVVTQHGWFAARPSGTENIYKLYAESFQGQAHLEAIVEQARKIVSRCLGNQ